MISSISRFALLSTLLPCSLSLAGPAVEAVAGVSEKISSFQSESILNEGLACRAMAESFPRLKSLEGDILASFASCFLDITLCACDFYFAKIIETLRA